MDVTLTSRQRDLVVGHLPLAGKLVSARRLHAPRHADFDNLLGEAQLALVRAARSWNGTGSFGAYATVCIRNALSRAMGSAARSTWASLEAESPDRPATADVATEAITLADYRAAKAQLTDLERQTIALAAAGFGPADQAALLRLPVVTVRQRLWRARQRLGQQLAA